MFQGCNNLSGRSPAVIEAHTIGASSCSNMFRGTAISEITCLATDISASDATTNWVYLNTASTGTFYKATSMSSWTTGNNGIPANWTVIDAS
jgi:hypothetical protein